MGESAPLMTTSAPLIDRVDRALAAIERLNPTWHAFSQVCTDARAQALALQQALDAGHAHGPLHGTTFSIKGCIPVAGLRWTEGSAIHAQRIATEDAALVARVRAAGGIVLGTTTLSELAMYAVTNAFEPMGLNPWDPARTAGGSSTGAAVAAALGLAQVNIGTDSGGSVRNPACHCGVVGFMPRIGALSLAGQSNATPSLTSVGLIARDLPTIETAWAVLADAPGASIAMTARRLLRPRALIERMCDAPTAALFAAACARLERAGFALIDAEIPGWTEGEQAAGVVSRHECGQALAQLDLTHAGAAIRARAAQATQLAAAEVEAARAARAHLRRTLAQALAATGATAVLTPTWPFAAPLITADSVEVRGERVSLDPRRSCFVRAANAVDGCAITLPMGLYPDERVPAGLHLLASGGDEQHLLATAREVAQALAPAPHPPAVSSP
jgi:aspartyl-tRNA(Asn)/glutamyl-tRNA(Gln) amidotransferase subunit A